MKLETFFGKFDLLADAPNSVAKLRELVLESAIRGQLVPQDTSDEPASKLLERMACVQNGHTRKQLRLPTVCDDAYLPIPPGWSWTRLGNTGRVFNGDSVSESGKSELARVEEGLPFIATKDVGYGRDTLAYDNGLKVPLGDPRFKVAHINAVLICAEGGSAGRKIGITDRDICFGNKLYANELQKGIHHRYIFYVYQAPTFFEQFAARMTGIIGGIARSEFLSLPIPVPPEEEQKRIVTKVDELMALCDRLEAQQAERAERHTTLARAALARFAEDPTPANLTWLFHDAFPIPPADLRKAILTLAVQGKLVPQDPNDKPIEDAFNGLESVELQSADRTELPVQWKLCTYRSVTKLVTSGSRGWKEFYAAQGSIFVRTQNIKTDKLVLDDVAFVDLPKSAEGMRTQVMKDDILITITGANVTKSARVEKQISEAYVSQHIALTRPRWSEMSEWLYLCFISHGSARGALEQLAYGDKPGLNLNNIRDLRIPIPSLAEQRRIVTKVDQLMALVDQLEAQLTASRTTAEKLLEALVVELTSAQSANRSGQAEVIELRSSPEFIRTVLAAEIADRIGSDDTFGQTKLQKIFHLTEYIFELPEIDSHPSRFARGPHDPKLIGQVETKMKQLAWFKETMRPDGHGHQYLPLANAGDQKAAFEKLWPKKATAIRHFIDEMKTWKTERCERFATLYAAWNDLILWQKPITDSSVVDEVLQSWHPDKLNIPKAKWLEMLQWMKEESYIPRGFGRTTKDLPQEELF